MINGEIKLGPFAIVMVASTALCPSAHAEEPPTTVLDTVEVISEPLQEKIADTARPVTVIKAEQLATQAGNTIGSTLEKEPGMSNQSFGPGVGSPVIRGQAGPRVRVMQNGVGANDVSNVSPDHANG